MLSDACAEYLDGLISTADLYEAVNTYSQPRYATWYGCELKALQILLNRPKPDEPAIRKLAELIMVYHFTPPGHSEEAARKQAMDEAVAQILDEHLRGLAARVPSLLRQQGDQIIEQPWPPVIRQEWITRQDVRANRDQKVYVFGDNMLGEGFGGQAKAMRGQPNAIGVPTKWRPDRQDSSYFTDADFDAAKPVIDAAFDRIDDAIEAGKQVVIPADGLGTGLAELPKRAPKIFAYIEAKIRDLEQEPD